MILSIEDSIKRLKAEIISQDWRLSQTRSELLEAAFHCLRQRFKNRKATSAMLTMAASVLEYIKKRGGNPPETIDFLKEAMAHVVNLYEDLSFDPEKEEKVFKGLFKRFQALKEKIKAGEPVVQSRPIVLEERTVESAGAPAPPETMAFKEIDDESGPAAGSSTVTGPDRGLGRGEAERLINDLKTSLEKADEVGSAIAKLFGEILKAHNDEEAERPGPARGSWPETESAGLELRDENDESVNRDQGKADKYPPPPIKACPPTALCGFEINGSKAALLSGVIAMVKPVPPEKLKKYQQNSNVPLKDFAGFMQGLSKKFSGNLAKIKDRKLKKLELPIMEPHGIDQPDIFDEKADSLLIISNGNWHGALACSAVQEEAAMMVKFEKRKNGDFAGNAYLEDGRRVKLLDSLSILRREGFLLMA